MLEIAKIIDRKLQYPCIHNFTSYQRRIPYVLRGEFLWQAHHNLPSASVCVENDRRSRKVGLVDISSEELVEAMVSVATKLWASLGDDAKALFDTEVWSGWVAPSWK